MQTFLPCSTCITRYYLPLRGWLEYPISTNNPGFRFLYGLARHLIRPFWTFAQKLKVNILKLKLQKLKFPGLFAQSSKFWQFFSEASEDVYPNITIFCLKPGKFLQKLKNSPISQGTLSKKLKFSGKSTTIHLPENRPKKY